MDLVYLLYVSRSTIDPDNAESEIDRIMALSMRRNADQRLTGSMLYTGRYFAQAFEGAPESVAAMLDSISRDARHSGVEVAIHCPIEHRRFSDYRLAYSGQSSFVERHVTRVLGAEPGPERDRAADQLTTLLIEFASDQ